MEHSALSGWNSSSKGRTEVKIGARGRMRFQKHFTHGIKSGRLPHEASDISAVTVYGQSSCQRRLSGTLRSPMKRKSLASQVLLKSALYSSCTLEYQNTQDLLPLFIPASRRSGVKFLTSYQHDVWRRKEGSSPANQLHLYCSSKATDSGHMALRTARNTR